MKTSIIIISGILILIRPSYAVEDDYSTISNDDESELIDSPDLPTLYQRVIFCCQYNAVIYSVNKCNDTRPIRIPDCKGKRFLLKREMFYVYHVEDAVYLVGSIPFKNNVIPIFASSSQFCISSEWNTSRGLAFKPPQTAIVCVELTNEPPALVYVLLLLNVCSTILCIVTCFLYHILPPLRDTHGETAFHFSLTWSLFHAVTVYKLSVAVFDATSSDSNTCFVNMYVQIYVVLVAFMWSLILSYHTWLQSKMFSHQHLNERARMIIYKCIGYGLPGCLILTASLHAHIKHINDELMYDELCKMHAKLLEEIYVFVPACFAFIMNIAFLISSQLRMSRNGQRNSSTKSIRGIHYRVFMSIKLLVVTGIPLLIGVIFLTFVRTYRMDISISIAIAALVLAVGISCEGIFIFLIMVVFRKRVLRAIGQSGLIPCHFAVSKWKNMTDSETDDENDNVRESVE